MHRAHRLSLLLATLAALACTAAASDDPPGKSADEVLAAMDRTSTYGHPDEFHEFAGMHCYMAGNYPCAMAHFLQAARYADKLSQLGIGLMYLNGEGASRDPVAAFAWVAIAAERKYPQFVATRDRIWAGLDATQRAAAAAMVDQLYPEYGDASAKPRMAKVLRRVASGMTGSLLGFGASSIETMTPAQYLGLATMPGLASGSGGAMPPCGASSIDGAPITGCGNVYAQWRWDPKQYFESRDAARTGVVTVGPLEQVRRDATSNHPASDGNQR
ncbi:hypothetical protein SAMN04487997_0814 [Frateuria terrea]|uniref:Sel1 repeat-containing protein n=1 Tax=Frateuria terrea TaxID=529704 RepID=A0A1H6QSP6_9GAMM|nr:hypothetical protein SAMN04487997_0814 [Frateuria terrea]SFP12448.1 hypothetical protein SAMN02927913_0729 [Frateuria terrea]